MRDREFSLSTSIVNPCDPRAIFVTEDPTHGTGIGVLVAAERKNESEAIDESSQY